MTVGWNKIVGRLEKTPDGGLDLSERLRQLPTNRCRQVWSVKPASRIRSGIHLGQVPSVRNEPSWGDRLMVTLRYPPPESVA